MGAYANPQEIEGQVDLTQNSRNLQHMFDTITSGAQKASERLATLHDENVKRNIALNKEVTDQENKFQALVAIGAAKNDTGLNYDFMQDASKDFVELAKKQASGNATPEDKRTSAFIMASPTAFSNLASNTSSMIKTYKDALALPDGAEGAVDLKGTNPVVAHVLVGLNSKNNKMVKLGFNTNNDKKDYSQNGIYATGLKGAEGENLKDEFFSGPVLEEALNGSGLNGMVYVQGFTSDIDKIQKTFPVQENGEGIFVMKGDTWTGNVGEEYLLDEPGEPIIEKGTEGKGHWRTDTRKVNKKAIYDKTKLQTDAVAVGNMGVNNRVASQYNNFVLKGFDGMSKAGFKTKNGRPLEDYEKYTKIPGYDGDFAYNINVDKNNPELTKAIQQNQSAALLSAIKEEQPVGKRYFVPDPEEAKPVGAKTAKTAKTPAAVTKQNDWNARIKEVIESGQGGTPIKNGLTLTRDEKGAWSLLDKDALPYAPTQGIHEPYILQKYIGGTAKRTVKTKKPLK